MTEKRIQRWVKEGRGRGDAMRYKPWLTVRDVSSIGFVIRVVGRKTGRIHHLMSYLEFLVFLHFDSQPDVVDIREQYPLERSATREIAQRLEIKHPIYPYTNIPVVMTTDLLVTIRRRDGLILLARAVKPADKLSNLRAVEKLQIERVYWDGRVVDWGVTTDLDLPKALTENLYRMRFAHSMDDHQAFSKAEGRQLQRRMLELIPRNSGSTYAEFCTDFDALVGLKHEVAHFLLTNLMLHGVVMTDLHHPWSVKRPLNQFAVVPSAFDGIVASDE